MRNRRGLRAVLIRLRRRRGSWRAGKGRRNVQWRGRVAGGEGLLLLQQRRRRRHHGQNVASRAQREFPVEGATGVVVVHSAAAAAAAAASNPTACIDVRGEAGVGALGGSVVNSLCGLRSLIRQGTAGTGATTLAAIDRNLT
jgi:hypothetical protein